MGKIDLQLTKQHFSTKLIADIIYFLKLNHPAVDLNKICDEVGLSEEYLTNESNWVSVRVMRKFCDLCIERSGCDDLAFKVGQFSMASERLGKTIYFIFRNGMSLDFLFHYMPRISSLFVKVTANKILETRPNFVRIRLSMVTTDLSDDEQNDLKVFFPLMLENALGYYSTIPTCQNLQPAQIEFEKFTSRDGIPFYELQIHYQSSDVSLHIGRFLFTTMLSLFLAYMLKMILRLSLLDTAIYVLFIDAIALLVSAHIQLRKGRVRYEQSFVLLGQADQRYLSLQKAKENIESLSEAYKKFVPWEFLSLLNRGSITDLKLGDSVEKTMTVLFLDIRNFTNTVDSMSPTETMNFINGFLLEVAPLIRKHGGFIDKYMGDAIMAIFPDTPDSAIRCALDISKQVAIINIKRRLDDLMPINFGIGISTGPMRLGTVGYQEQMGVTVVSSTVNIAARLEAINKEFGTSIAVSEDTINAISDHSFFDEKFLGRVQLRGKPNPVNIYGISISGLKAIDVRENSSKEDLMNILQKLQNPLPAQQLLLSDTEKLQVELKPLSGYVEKLKEVLGYDHSEVIRAPVKPSNRKI